jgi:hypothetical protein
MKDVAKNLIVALVKVDLCAQVILELTQLFWREVTFFFFVVCFKCDSQLVVEFVVFFVWDSGDWVKHRRCW